MKVHEVQENLKRTIAAKEHLLESHRRYLRGEVAKDAEMVSIVTIQFLEINIEELQRILVDVDKAVEQYNELGWALNPERMGQ